MDFISAKETAALWGITPRRVAILAKSGRIPGAWQMGHNWMIPRDAQKPLNPKESPADISSHHSVCTLYFNRFDGTQKIRLGLNHDEQLLYDAQEHFVHNELKEAEKILKDLIKKVSDRYILIGCYIMLGYISVESHNISLYNKCLMELHLIFAEDFPARKMLKFFLDDIEAHSAIRELRTEEFDMPSLQDFSPEFLPVVLVGVYYSALINQAKGKKKADTTLLEIVCLEFDKRGFYFTTQLLHTYLACIYFLNDSMDSCMSHIKIALDLAVKYDSYYALASAYRFLSSCYEKALTEYPDEVKEKLLARSRNLTEGLELFDKHFSTNTSGRNSLSLRDYEYIVYALRGLTNKEVADIKKISEPTVSRYYSVICENVGVQSKKELITAIRSSCM